MQKQQFLDYELKDTGNGDGVVLMKAKHLPHELYETHLGNYGTGEKGFDAAKKAAIVYFMIARPADFATTICHKVMREGSGTMHEYYLLRDVLKREGLQMPPEITPVDGMNAMIGYKGELLLWKVVKPGNKD